VRNVPPAFFARSLLTQEFCERNPAENEQTYARNWRWSSAQVKTLPAFLVKTGAMLAEWASFSSSPQVIQFNIASFRAKGVVVMYCFAYSRRIPGVFSRGNLNISYSSSSFDFFFK
jgi:hypothetical protein